MDDKKGDKYGMLKDKDGNNSSKRIIGFVVFMWAMAVVSVSVLRNVDVPTNSKDVLIALVYGASLMITGGVAEGMFKR